MTGLPIPDTLPDLPAPQHRTDNVEHYVLPMYEIVTGVYQNVPVRADAVTILGTHPVRVFADSQPVVADENLTPYELTATRLGPSFQPRFDTAWAGFAGRRFTPALSFTIRRTIRRLTIIADDPNGDFAAGNHVGVVHVWLHSNGVEDVSLGLPLTHILGEGFAGAATASVTLNIQPNINSLAPTVLTPASIEIYGMNIVGTWSGAAGVINSVTFQHRTSGAAFVISNYLINANFPFDVDFGQSLVLSGYNMLSFNAGDNRGLFDVVVALSQTVTALSLLLRCRSLL